MSWALGIAGVAVTLLGGAAEARPVREPAAPERHALPVYKLDRPVLGPVHGTLKPAVVLEHRGLHIERIAGYGGEVELHAFRKLVVLETSWHVVDDDGADRSEWSVYVSVGGRLEVPTRELLDLARSGARLLGRGIEAL